MGHHHHHHSLLHLPSFGRKDSAAPPKGCMAIKVGLEGEEEQQRFVVPVTYLNHHLFVGLLKKAEEEYGFDQKGAITIPCRLDHFHRVQGIIERDRAITQQYQQQHSHHHHHHHHNHHHHFHLTSCFGA